MNVFLHIKERITIVDVVREYVALKPAGIYLKGSCPFHHERTASFTVSPHKGIFYCFGCHATGDAISFIAQIERCSQFEAVKLLAERFNIELPETVNLKQVTEIGEKERYFALCACLTHWCCQQLAQTPAALDYVRSRAIAPPIADQFKLGFFPAGQSVLRQLLAWMQKSGFLQNDLLKYHIVVQGHALYSPFENRILFPIADHLGRICAFGGRIFKPGDERAKYYNSKENEFFTKGSILFGLDAAKRHIQQAGAVFLVEGYLDCLAMVQYGYLNCVATLGTACTSEHLALLARYADDVFVVYDGDQAGLNAMLRLTELCWNANLNVKIITLPAGHDPASFLTAGHTLTTYIAQANDVFSFYVAQVTADFGGLALKKKLAVVEAVVAMVYKISDPVKRELLLQQAAVSLNVAVQTLRSARPAAVKTRTVVSQATPTRAPQLLPALSDAHKHLFCLIMEHPALMVRDDVAALVDTMPESARAIVYQRARAAGETFAYFAQMLDDEQRQLTYALVIAHDKTDAVPEHVIRELARQQWKEIVAQTKERIAQGNDDPEHVAALMQRLQELKTKIFGGSL